MPHRASRRAKRLNVHHSHRAARRSALSRAVVCVAEALEPRVLLSAVAWLGGSGDWDTASKWSTGAVPSFDEDNVTIPSGSNVTVAAADGTVGGATLTTAPGSTLTVNSGADLDFSDGTGTIAGTFVLGGILAGNGSTSVALMGSTTLTGSLQFPTTNSGTMTIDAGSITGTSLTSSGTVTVTDGLTDFGTFTNSTGGTVNFTDDTGVNVTGGGGMFINQGTLNQTGGTGTNVFASGVVFENNGGTINIQSGNFQVEGSASFQGGQINVPTGSKFEINNGNPAGAPNIDLGGTIGGSGSGEIDLDSGQYIPQIYGAGTPATLDFTTETLNVGQVSFQTNTDQISNAGTMNFVGNTYADIVIDNSGTINNDGSASLIFGGGTSTNAPTGIINLTNDFGLAGGNELVNEGTINKTGGTGTSTVSCTIDNLGGTFNVNTGTILFTTNEYFDNLTVNVATGSDFNINTGDPQNSPSMAIAGTLTGTGGGQVNIDTGTYYPQVEGGAQQTATFDFPQGMLYIGDILLGGSALPAEAINTGYIDFDSDDGYQGIGLVNKGTIELTGTSNLSTGSNYITNNGTGIIDFDADSGISPGDANFTDLTNKGTIEKTGGSGTSAIDVTFFNDGGTVDVQTGTLSIQGGTDYTAGPINVDTGADLDFDNDNHVGLQGTFTSTGGGIVTVSSGFLTGPDADFAGQNTADNAVLDFGPNTFYLNNGAYLVNYDNLTADGLENTGYVYNDGNGRGLNYTVGVGEFTNAGTYYLNGNIEWEKGGIVTNLPTGILDFNGSASIFLNVVDRLTNEGTILLDPGAGNTLDFASPFIADFVNNDVPSLNNTGTIEAVSGTIKYPAISMGSTVGDFTGGTLKVDAGATLNSDTSFPITTNDGGIILGGAGASFPDAAGLAVNDGTFKVLSGATFSTVSSLVNNGTLTVGGTVTVNGDLDEASANSALKFIVGAAAGSTGAPNLAVSGNTTLAGTLSASFSNGFAAAAGTPYTVANFAIPAIGSFSSTAGVGPAFSVTVGPTNIVLDSTAAGGADLDVSDVTAPSTFSPGQTGTIGYTVTNIAAGVATGPWTDSIFLSPSGTISSSDILLANVTNTGNLAQNGSYTISQSVTFPAAAGTFKILVETDSGLAVSDLNRANNIAVSSELAATIPALALNGSVSGTITVPQTLIYQLTVPGGADVRVVDTLGAADVADLEISRGVVPTVSTAQYYVSPQSSDVTAITIPAPTPGIYYIVITGQPGAPANTTFTLSATSYTHGVFGVSPATLGRGNVTTTISGSGFESGSTVELLDGSSNVVAQATSSTTVDPNTINANFDLASVAVGTYTIAVITGGRTDSLANSVTVVAATSAAGAVQFTESGPSSLRPYRTYQLTVTYTNTSTVDVPAPMMMIEDPELEFQIAGGDPNGNLGPESSFTPEMLGFLAINQEGDAGVLPPGHTGTLLINFQAVDAIAHQEVEPEIMDLGDAINSSTGLAQTTDLGALVGNSPLDLNPTTAKILAAQINGQSSLLATTAAGVTGFPLYNETIPGATYTDLIPETFDESIPVSDAALNSYLDNVATVLSRAGQWDANYNGLLTTAAQAADGFGNITQQQTDGVFGYGVPDPLTYTLTFHQGVDGFDGFVFVRTPFGYQTFLETGNNTFIAEAPGDTSTMGYDATNNRYVVTEPSGVTMYFPNGGIVSSVSKVINADGTAERFSLNSARQVASVTEKGLTESFVYNSDGVIISSTDAYGNVTTYGYQVVTNAVPNTDLTATTPQDVPLLTTITNGAGTTTIQYATQPHLQQVRLPDSSRTARGIISGIVQGYDYNAFYNTSPVLIAQVSSITLPDGSGEEYTYDGLGRLIKTTLLDGSEPITNVYDSTGLDETTTYPDGSSVSATLNYNGQPLKITDATGKITTLSYNSQGLLTSILSPLGENSRVSYTSDTPTQTVDGGGVTTISTLNSHNQPVTLTDGNGNVIGLAYNSSNLISTITYSNGSTEQFQYDANADLTQATQPSGLTDTLTYDNLDEPTSSTFSDGTHYDFAYSGGLLTSASGSGGATSISHNSAQHVAQITDPAGHVVTYSYDSLNRVTSIADSTGTIETYSYDSDARLASIHDGSGNLIAQYTYDVDGRISMVVYGNGTKTVYSYDAASRISQISNLTSSNTVSSSQTYAYNALNLPISMTDQNGQITTYAYDQSNQLIQVGLPGGQTITYTYDADGNRTSVVNSGTTTNYSVNNMDQYTSAGTTTYAYDANGNLISQTDGSGTTTYAYNDLGKLTGSTGPNGTFTYNYDSLGQLLSFTKNGVTTTFERDAEGNVIGAFDASGNLIDHYVYGDGLVAGDGGSAGALYYQSDLTGNVTAITSSSGTLANTYSYLPYGEPVSSTGSAVNFFTYSGFSGVLSLGDGFYQTQNRTYDPTIGRFMQPDPSGLSSGLNRYTYVGNSPSIQIDPSGLHEGSGGESKAGGGHQNGGGAADSGTTSPGQFVEGDAPIPSLSVPIPGGEAGAFVAAGATTHPDGSVSVELTGGIGAKTGPPITTGVTTANPEGSGVAPVLTVSQWTPAGGGKVNVLENETEGIIAPGAGSGIMVNGGVSYTVRGADYATIRDGYKNFGPQGQNLQNIGDDQVVPTGVRQQPYSEATSYFLARMNAQKARAYAHMQHVNFKQLGYEGTIAYLHSIDIFTKESLIAHILLAGDPNDIQGPSGFGDAGYVTASQPFPYRIDFTNESTASAPAQDVVVTQQLSSNLDWNTFQLSSFGFGKYVVNIPAGLQSYSTQVNATATTGLYVDVSLTFDSATGQLTVTFTSIDPNTLAPTNDATAGFLPPDNSNGRGEGYVSYTVSPNGNEPSGTVINAQATVVFDTNAPINTVQIANTLDAIAPTSAVTPLPATQTDPNFTVSWSGQDDTAGSGIASYDIYYSEDGGAPMPLLIGTTDTSTTFAGQPGHTYSFFSIATDNVGNVQPTPQAAQATTQALGDTAVLSSDGVLQVLGTAGDDTIDVSVSAGNVIATINGTAQTPEPLASVTSVSVNGGEGNDTITIEAGVPPTIVLGGPGDDTIVAQNANDTLKGDAGNDSIQAGTGSNLIAGGSGDDTLQASSGSDTLMGQAGNDSLTAGAGNDSLGGGAGADTIVGGAGQDTLTGGAGDNSLQAGTGNNSLGGGSGADTLVGGAGSDTLDGGDGPDSLVGGAGPGLLTGDAGVDILVGGSGNQTLSGGAGADSLKAGSGNDLLKGGKGADTLKATAGNDTLVGGKGADSITGGSGNDSLSGGPGVDTIVASTNPAADTGIDTIDGGGQNDSITGTSANDVILDT